MAGFSSLYECSVPIMALLFEVVSGHMVLDMTLSLKIVAPNKGSFCSNSSASSKPSCIPRYYFAIIDLETNGGQTVSQTIRDAYDKRPVAEAPTELAWRISSWDAEKSSGITSMLITFAFSCGLTNPSGCGVAFGSSVFASARLPLKQTAWNSSMLIRAPLAPISVLLDKLSNATLSGSVAYRYSCASGVGPKCDNSCRSEVFSQQMCNGFMCYSNSTMSDMCCDYAISNGKYHCSDMRSAPPAPTDELRNTVIGLAVAVALLLLFIILVAASLIGRCMASRQRRRVVRSTDARVRERVSLSIENNFYEIIDDIRWTKENHAIAPSTRPPGNAKL